ncbi:conserved hypothetical protein [Ricinus communis]|uniref:Uncharacterized protein n=1 Tax=Ricinus communis TaxID=3988 RepID=B9RJ13_RICCO|nr:conserved hypothetical protein [Ricinus communis]
MASVDTTQLSKARTMVSWCLSNDIRRWPRFSSTALTPCSPLPLAHFFAIFLLHVAIIQPFIVFTTLGNAFDVVFFMPNLFEVTPDIHRVGFTPL